MCVSFIVSTVPSQKPRISPTAQFRQTKPEAPEIPKGATLEPVLTENSLSRRLENLSFGFENANAKCLRYRCRHGHVVTSRPGTQACRACPVCRTHGALPCMNTSRRKLSLCQLGAVASDRGGTLLSTHYMNARTPLTWRCSNGHVWNATASNVRSANSWCPECARQKRKATVEDMQAMAKELGGKCLSTDYISEHVKLRWQCAKGHEFFLAPNNIRRGSSGARKPSWCKICRREARQRNSTRAGAAVSKKDRS